MANTNIKVFPIDEHLRLIDYNQVRAELLTNPEVQELENMLSADYGTNIRIERKVQLVWRDMQIVRKLKEKYGFKCQICGYQFQMDNGQYYCEAHHIIPISENGSQSEENVIILCANHHRMFHYAKNTILVGPLLNKMRTIQIGNEKFDIEY